ncbi:MAG TPA: hypothetical protein VF026_06840 [Ktedonobacteraceae bacterium]
MSPLLDKSADVVLAALAQARTLFPFPLLGIDTDSGAEFLNEELIAYCEQEHLTFTRGRPAVKNDQCHSARDSREYLDVLRRALLRGTQTTAADGGGSSCCRCSASPW